MDTKASRLRTLSVAEDRWLAGIFGHGVFRLVCGGPWESLAERNLRVLTEHEKGRGRAFYYGKVPTAAAGAVRLLNGAGYCTVDVNVTFDRDPGLPALPAPECEIVKVEGEGPLARGAVAIAGSCFRYSRFHLDPLVPPELAHRVKAEWIENYVRGKRGDGLYVALHGGKPAGFLAVIAAEEAGRKVFVIDLVGVAASAQGRGVGRSLTRFFVNEFRGRCGGLQVGTQAANVPSMRLYESCGFRVRKTAYVLHKHVPPCAA